ncbi:hypothetical protein B0H12DRAFT_1092418 [Mycena haematopus]|nr:hypothetical protein B0H12DRAFT_1092418 [Mycena haematopus]
MSAFTRFLRATPAARRPYSSFFSKPGGGRYFNNSHASSKPAAKPVVAGRRSSSAARRLDLCCHPRPAPSNASPNPNANPNPNASPSVNANSPSPLDADPQPLVSLSVPHPQPHPTLDPEEFKLHQFFALHRPLLLLGDPAAVLTSPPPHVPLFPEQQATAPEKEKWSWDGGLPDGAWVGTGMSADTAGTAGTKHPVDHDAEVARQLTRALAMTCVGARVAWDDTLRRLGMDVDTAAQDLRAAEWNQEWEDILADSVKRKRRKKMKKHK